MPSREFSRTHRAGARGLDSASGFSDACMIPDPSVCSLDLSFRFYKMKLMN